MVVLIVLVGARRFIVGAQGGDLSGTLLGLAAGIAVTAFVLVTTVGLYNRKIRSLSTSVGKGGWAAPCVDQQAPRRWHALLVDAVGVRLVGRSGDVRRNWRWQSIRDVTVERFPLALVSHAGVVLHLADGSTAELLLPSRTTLAYPPARAEAAASEIRKRLDASRGRSAFPTAPPT